MLVARVLNVVAEENVLAGRYVIETRLGDGGMGVVYRARHIKFGRAFAIKVLHKTLMQNPKIVRRFEREAELAGRLRHTNVASVIDIGVTDEGLHFMAMELALGHSLADLLDDGPISEVRMLDLAKQLCSGLQHAHDHGLIHRDFKPHNVIVEQVAGGREVARIVDWGVAILREDAGDVDTDDRLTTRGIVVGTPHYMAPEQARGDAIDHRVDLFALGLICYEMLTGRMPFEGSGVEVARANLSSPIPRMNERAPDVHIDPVLEAVVRRLLEKDRANRPPSGNAARELFELYERDRASCALLLGVDLGDGAADDLLIGDMPVGDPAPNGPLIVGPAEPIARDTELDRERIARDPERDLETDQLQAASGRRQIAIIVTVAACALLFLLWLGLRGGRTSAPAAATLDAGPSVEHIALEVTDAAVLETPAELESSKLAAMPPLVFHPPTQRPRLPGGSGSGSAAPPVDAPSAVEVANLYGSIGRELKALGAAKGMDATIDLWPRYRWIRINEWITTPERRTHVAQLLERLRSDIRASE